MKPAFLYQCCWPRVYGADISFLNGIMSLSYGTFQSCIQLRIGFKALKVQQSLHNRNGLCLQLAQTPPVPSPHQTEHSIQRTCKALGISSEWPHQFNFWKVCAINQHWELDDTWGSPWIKSPRSIRVKNLLLNKVFFNLATWLNTVQLAARASVEMNIYSKPRSMVTMKNITSTCN